MRGAVAPLRANPPNGASTCCRPRRWCHWPRSRDQHTDADDRGYRRGQWVPTDQIAVLSGPNLAREVAERQPAATVIACPDEDRAKQLQAAFSTAYFRPYTNTDVVGCEIGGAVKNVIALACGMARGMGFRMNTLATIITWLG